MIVKRIKIGHGFRLKSERIFGAVLDCTTIEIKDGQHKLNAQAYRLKQPIVYD